MPSVGLFVDSFAPDQHGHGAGISKVVMGASSVIVGIGWWLHATHLWTCGLVAITLGDV